MNMKTNDTRQHILDVGYQLVVSKGFTNVGLSELLKTADVPKGSFYHYFKSKEQFGEALINDYFADYSQRIHDLFADQHGTAYQRLMRYWQYWHEQSEGQCHAQRCLVVKLSAEVADLSDAMRIALLNGANAIIHAIAQCIEQGVNEGSIYVQHSQLTAELLYNLWIGASLLSKLRQDNQGLDQALITTEQILQGKPVS
ncbi:TetR/AcrR family transcriptional regulator [Vibrio metschnikovii]|uniref:TetR/AcrR family transcriptional regulator n=4 Tax=Unclassified Bacteria TaxID=49928 RepID=A0AAU6SVB9_UNCXX|nr:MULTISPECIES: TetR/AcrR family transcriptional regulator [Vibrio]EKO3557178.1 TetR/AcrR family transcriptional regulator [Vibrio metschnikovii]EKO3568865.1 TetR/AcrR family transcriptional regulator [Vibrio metschnikovii]EKO3571760.1 TetR/AcrR family transcriptional regulator [Vibrio metschnikovii]EKO3574721.1 TetR/AcrR family transcriptional regulator [Vibrio metschnikovii]EKO3579771.1 TetR/AcrR family transcriptional regulator [Vibrio metschnikovii]